MENKVIQTILRLLLIALLLWSLAGYMLHPIRGAHIQASYIKWHIIVEQGMGLNSPPE